MLSKMLQDKLPIKVFCLFHMRAIYATTLKVHLHQLSCFFFSDTSYSNFPVQNLSEGPSQPSHSPKTVRQPLLIQLKDPQTQQQPNWLLPTIQLHRFDPTDTLTWTNVNLCLLRAVFLPSAHKDWTNTGKC